MPIYLLIDGQVSGPFSAEELALLWHEGDVTADAMFWYEGMPFWRSVDRFEPAPAILRVMPGHVILSTAPHIANREVLVERQIITAECVLGVNVFKDFVIGVTDIIGGRSQTLQGELRRARFACLSELQTEASNCGADAVIAVRLDYSEIGGKSMLMLVASGTAVKLKVAPPLPPTA